MTVDMTTGDQKGSVCDDFAAYGILCKELSGGVKRQRQLDTLETTILAIANHGLMRRIRGEALP